MDTNDRTAKAAATGWTVAGVVFAIALILTFVFLLRPGREVPAPPASQAVAPKAETTPDLKGDTESLKREAPPDSTGAGPNAPQTR